jgi:hypothetical protein
MGRTGLLKCSNSSRAISKSEFESLLNISQDSDVSSSMINQIWADIDLDCDGLVKYVQKFCYGLTK